MFVKSIEKYLNLCQLHLPNYQQVEHLMDFELLWMMKCFQKESIL